MRVEPIEIRVTVGAAVYTITEVGDIDDVMFLTQVGRAVALILIEHGKE